MNNRISLLKKGLLQDSKEKLQALEIKIDGLTKSINYALFKYDGIESIDIGLAEQNFKELVEALDKYRELRKQIKEIMDNG
ncbi:MAG: hypothetical protein HZA78_10655 [Candidatus Schekmanbacteria bacterium]|nr:hypothetical protein [Candidatus Schekmanbacteria bacterium]